MKTPDRLAIMREKSTDKRSPEPYVLTPKQQKRIEEVSEVTPSKVNHFRKAYGSKSLRSAITAKCLECVSFEAAEIRRCSAESCPLWSVRPYQVARSPRPRNEKTVTQSEAEKRAEQCHRDM